VVLRALQQHGAVIYDSTTAGQDGAKLLAMSNGWAGTEYLTAQAELNKVPMSAFEVVDVSGIRVDPATGWQISQWGRPFAESAGSVTDGAESQDVLAVPHRHAPGVLTANVTGMLTGAHRFHR